MNAQLITTYSWLFIKILYIIGVGIYSMFAGIMVRQEAVMSKVFGEASEPFLRILVYIHFGVALFALLLAILIL